ncbi:DUF6507 family protein [Streptomyces gobiensis]|uniref:DUF6507 family protein n=1 Tax=Streptomyces gobiensis TaxID=2875706 RepID=UPI00241141E3|nr:DUF6507 family protein [Streptomyces gobiensis]UGY93032.1 DUF6507 family protein [Streptomyces gobiensis]
MSRWDISPQSAQGVLKKTIAVAEKLQGQAKSYGSHLQGAATNAGTLYMGEGKRPQAGLIGAALGEFAEGKKEDLLFIGARAGKSLNGAQNAMNAYLRGDQAMAERVQRAATASPDMERITKAQAEKG